MTAAPTHGRPLDPATLGPAGPRGVTLIRDHAHGALAYDHLDALAADLVAFAGDRVIRLTPTGAAWGGAAFAGVTVRLASPDAPDGEPGEWLAVACWPEARTNGAVLRDDLTRALRLAMARPVLTLTAA